MGEHACDHGSFKRAAVLLAALLSLLTISFAQTPAAKAVGTVKSVNGNSLVITTDSGSEQTVTFADSARIVRATPGQTDLKTAPAISVSDLQAGDRVVARGQAGENGGLIVSSAIVMKQGDVAEGQRREHDEWRKGVGGIVKQVDPAAATVTVANAMVASGKPIIVHVARTPRSAAILRIPLNSMTPSRELWIRLSRAISCVPAVRGTPTERN